LGISIEDWEQPAMSRANKIIEKRTAVLFLIKCSLDRPFSVYCTAVSAVKLQLFLWSEGDQQSWGLGDEETDH
jgi:hypothetical protein